MPDDTLADDLLRGVEAIAAYIGVTPTQANHSLAKGYLPARKVGRLWVARKSTLDRFFDTLTVR